MTKCELCGKTDAKYNTEIEGTMMHVCEDCSKFGKVKGNSNINIIVKEKIKHEFKEPTYIFLPGFGAKVKNAREKMNMNQEDFAKKLNLKLSVLHQIESEHFKPDVETAKKLEHSLHIKIIEEITEEDEDKMSNNNKKLLSVTQGHKSGPLTLGDMIQIKKKK